MVGATVKVAPTILTTLLFAHYLDEIMSTFPNQKAVCASIFMTS